jgi:hypothetical protein
VNRTRFLSILTLLGFISLLAAAYFGSSTRYSSEDLGGNVTVNRGYHTMLYLVKDQFRPPLLLPTKPGTPIELKGLCKGIRNVITYKQQHSDAPDKVDRICDKTEKDAKDSKLCISDLQFLRGLLTGWHVDSTYFGNVFTEVTVAHICNTPVEGSNPYAVFGGKW